MATARAIQISVTHVALGILSGTAIEAVMPHYSAASSDAAIAFEAAVQVAINGVFLSLVGAQLNSDDPTFGLPFSLGLFEAQPELRKRIAVLASVAARRANQFSQRTLPHESMEETPSRSM